VRQDHNRDFSESELPGCQYPAMAGDDVAIWSGQDRVVEAEFLDTIGNLCDLSLGMMPGISEVGDETINRPKDNFKRKSGTPFA